MKQERQSTRKARTRQLITAGGLLHKSGLLEAFHLHPGDDLQSYEHREKAAQLLGFLIECFEKNEFDDARLQQWKKVGERALNNY